MHFIGNRAIVLGDGADNIQLVYNPGLSALSAFIPVLALSCAFATAELQYRTSQAHWIALTTTGILSGFSVVAMHYIGNLGISNYHLHYVPAFLAASMLIAVGDCLAVLILFYTWRDKWISRWWKRTICAFTLAAGISAMHFTASTKCVYRFKHHSKPQDVQSRNIQVIVAGILCGAAAIIVISVLIFDRYRAMVRKTTSQKVMLASAMFDPYGRILVTVGGHLPSKEITDKYNHRTFSEEFNTAHSVFHWIFRVSRNWVAVSDMVGKMKSHLNSQIPGSDDGSRPSSSTAAAHYDGDADVDYSIIFRERFCIAAASLASYLQISINKMGVLYDKIIETGTLKISDGSWFRSTLSGIESADLELALPVDTYGTGQLLFLTRQLNAADADRLVNAGFRFATLQQVARNIATTMQIPLSTLEEHLNNLHRYVINLSSFQKPGTYLSLFAMIPKVLKEDGFNIAVMKSEQDQLPDVAFFSHDPVDWQIGFLQGFHGKSFKECGTLLEGLLEHHALGTPQEIDFARNMTVAMDRLSQIVPRAWLIKAKFCGNALQAHFSQPLGTTAPITWLYAFACCIDLHTSLAAYPTLTQSPLSFFKTRQQCYVGSPNHVVLAHEIHQKFAPLLARKQLAKKDNKVTRLTIPFTKSTKQAKKSASRRPSTICGNRTALYGSSTDVFGLGDVPRQPSSSSQTTQHDTPVEERWGGILVNSETVVESDAKSVYSIDSGNNRLGMTTAVTTSQAEDTFVDELVEFIKSTTKPRQ